MKVTIETTPPLGNGVQLVTKVLTASVSNEASWSDRLTKLHIVRSLEIRGVVDARAWLPFVPEERRRSFLRQILRARNNKMVRNERRDVWVALGDEALQDLAREWKVPLCVTADEMMAFSERIEKGEK